MTTATVQPGQIPGGQYNASPPALTDQQTVALQVDSAGNLKVTGAGTPSGTQDVNLTQVNGAATAKGHGTAATALRVELPTDGTGVIAGVTTVGTVTAVTTVSTVTTVAAVTAITNALPAGSAILGKVGVDQTTPGTTNGVSVVAAALGGYTPNNITTSTTTVVKSGAGTLHGINVNTLGTVASAAVVYDNTAGSGTKIATIDTLTVGRVGWNQYDVAFSTGLTIVTTGAPDITVSYK